MSRTIALEVPDKNELTLEILSVLANLGLHILEPKMLNRMEASKFMNVSADTFDNYRRLHRFPKPVSGKYSNLALAEWMRNLDNFQN